MMNKFRVAHLVLWLGISQLILILASWLITAAMPELFVRSLLSSEGIRWFFGHFASSIGSPFLVVLLVCFIAFGAVKSSGLLSLHNPMEFRERLGIRLLILEALVFIAIICLLTAVPHAILLSATGELWPSSFSNSIIPYCAFAICVMAISFALVSGYKRSLVEIFDMLTCGISLSAPWLLVYIFAKQLIDSFIFVLD